jgi:molybdenum cofactor cytidylyltransferase
VIAGVVLAAGGSTRLGRPKQLLRHGGRSLLRHAAACAVGASLQPALVVLGAQRERLRGELSDLPVHVVDHDGWTEGVASTIRAGLAALEATAPSASAVLLLACDQPLITAELLETICDHADGVAGRMVACAYGGSLGVPALFTRERFPELLALRGDHGAKQILMRHAQAVVQVPWPAGALDIDAPEDYLALMDRSQALNL